MAFMHPEMPPGETGYQPGPETPVRIRHPKAVSRLVQALRDEPPGNRTAVGPPLARRAVRGRPPRGAAAEVVAMVLAGGRGDRLQPLTRERAKPAVPFAGAYRIVDFTLANCVNSKVERIHVLTQYQSASVEEHVRGRWRRRIDLRRAEIRCPRRGYRGTADAVYRNLDALGDARWVLVLGADHLYRMDYREMIAAHVESGAEVTIAATEVPLAEARRMGVMTVDASWRIHAFDEKPAEPAPLPGRREAALVSMGIYAFSRAALVRELPAAGDGEHDFGRDVIPSMVRAARRVFAFPFRDPRGRRPGYWRDVGTLDSYFEAHMELLAASPGIDLDARDWPIAMRSAQPLPLRAQYSESEAGRGPVHSLIAPGSVQRGATVARSVLGGRSTVASGAHVEESVLLDGVVVERDATVRRAILDEGVRVAPGAGVGVDLEWDRRRFTVTDAGIVVVPRGAMVEA